MSLVSVTPMWSERSMSVSVSSTGAAQTVGLIGYDVVVDNPADDESVVLLGPGIPLIGISVHPAQPWLRCRGLHPQQFSPLHWRLTARYEGPVSGQSPQNPLEVPPKFKWGTVDREEAFDEDADGRPVCTPNGEPYDPPLRTTLRDLVLGIRRNIASFNPGLIVPYTTRGGATNSDSVLFQPPGTIRVNVLEANEILDDDFPYFDAYCELQFRRGYGDVPDDKAFYRRVRCQGFYELLPAADTGFTADVIMHAIRNGERVSRPILLYAEGAKKGQAIPVTPTDPWPTAEWLLFKEHDSLPLSTLGFF